MKKEERLPTNANDGELLHTKHAFPPNNLGYCGPDVRGKIEDYLHGSASADSILPYLTRFEAAYPFVKMIAKSASLSPFDYKVTEAYWLGNSLLNQVQTPEFYEFTHRDLPSSRKMIAGKKDGMNREEARGLFRQLGAMAKPHHTFYVLNMYARFNENPGTKVKLLELMDSCRISWGKVVEVKRDTLVVQRPALTLEESLALTRPLKKEVNYDPNIQPFNEIGIGDWVSLHWNFASEILTRSQLTNLRRFTALDIEATNRSTTFNEPKR